MNPTRLRVGVVLPNGPAYFTRLFKGIGTYCRGSRHWQFVAWPTRDRWLSEIERTIDDHQIDGVIGQASQTWEAIVAKGRLAFVNVEYNRLPFAALPRVGVDEAAAGRLASDHFHDRGLRNLAAVSVHESLPAIERVAAFTGAAGQWCSTPINYFQIPSNEAIDRDALEAWLRNLPQPVGIFCWNDETAKIVHDCCLAAELRMPEDMALLGVDNDEIICNFLEPELSSVDPNAQRVGYEAAALLDRLMNGQSPPDKAILVPPIGVVTRASTDMLALDNPLVVDAIRFIRENAYRPLSVKEVADHLVVSRRSLEKHFKIALGRTPRSEIQRMLVARAKDLLATTDWSIPIVASRCGYPSPNHFAVMFRKQTEQTPTAYRHQTRLR